MTHWITYEWWLCWNTNHTILADSRKQCSICLIISRIATANITFLIEKSPTNITFWRGGGGGDDIFFKNISLKIR